MRPLPVRVWPWLAQAVLFLFCAVQAVAEPDSPAPRRSMQQSVDSILHYEDSQLPEPSESRRQLQQILAEEQFSADGFDAAGPSPLERLLDWLQRLQSQTGLAGSSTTVMILTCLLFLAVCYLVFRLVWDLMQRRGFRSKAQGDSVRPEDLSAASLLKLATGAASSGDFRAAIRWRFLALLKQLDLSSSVLQTNSQLLRGLRRSHGANAAEPFGGAARCFEDAWYGGELSSEHDYRELEALADQAVVLLAPAPGEPGEAVG